MFFDPGPLVGSIPAAALAAVLGRADWLTCNAREAAILTGSADPRAAAAELAARSGAAGRAAGARAHRAGRLPHCPAGRRGVTVPGFAVGAVDTNGAGDAHSGAFIAALAAGAADTAAARSANAAAALSVTRRRPGHGADPRGTRPVPRHRLSAAPRRCGYHERLSLPPYRRAGTSAAGCDLECRA